MYYEQSVYGEDYFLGILMMIYVVGLGIWLISAIVNYILRGFGMYKMGNAEGKEHAWMAFVPFARTYFQGELGGPISFKKKTMQNPGMWMLIIPIIANVFIGIIYIVFIVVNAIGSMNSYLYDMEMTNMVSGAVSSLIVFFLFLIVFSMIYHAIVKVLSILVNHQIYARYTTDTMAIAHAVFGTIIPFYESICLFVFGRKAENDFDQNHPEECEQNEEQEIELPQICE